MRVALPVSDGQLDRHFGHCQTFAMVDIEDGVVKSRQDFEAPPHEPGLLPVWLAEKKANVVIAGGLGGKAQELLRAQGIDLIMGVSSTNIDQLLAMYIDGSLSSGSNSCENACSH